MSTNEEENKDSTRVEYNKNTLQQQEAWNSWASGPSDIAHNFKDIPDQLAKAGDNEAAEYYRGQNKENNDAKHFNDEVFDNKTNEPKNPVV
jgi:hypothetical protein